MNAYFIAVFNGYTMQMHNDILYSDDVTSYVLMHNAIIMSSVSQCLVDESLC